MRWRARTVFQLHCALWAGRPQRDPLGSGITMPPRQPGLIALSAFFALGAMVATLTSFALLAPGSALEPMWRLNPQAEVAFRAIGPWAIPLMLVVAVACALSAAGLRMRARWGHRLALTLLVVNLFADATNVLVRGDLRTLIGLPVAAALIVYLLSSRVRDQFTRTNAAA